MKYLTKPSLQQIFIFNNKLVFLFVLTCLILPSANGQQKKITEKFKKETILKMDSLIQKEYIFPDQAKLIAAHLKKSYKENKFKKYDLLDSFAVALTKEIRLINNDKHLRVKPKFVPDNNPNAAKDSYEIYLHHLTDNRKLADGFREVKILDGNIGYLNFKYFIHETNPTIDSYMQLLSKTDAIVIDLRTNGGGSPKTVQYLCSYFFKEPLLLNTLYFRKDNFTEEFRVTEVNGKKRIDVPLFIITGARSFSGAEEFSYNMQTQKRATLVGEVTGGGANPGEILELNPLLEIFIPTGTAINPITKTNWEGIGVIPEYKTTQELAYDKTIELAKKAAEDYRSKIAAESKKLYLELQSTVDQQTKPLHEADLVKMDQQIQTIIKKLIESDWFTEEDITNLSSDYTPTKPFIAESILKSNAELHPRSPIAFLKYGDLLEQNGKKDTATAVLKKAVELATEIKAPYLEGIKNRYEKILK